MQCFGLMYKQLTLEDIQDHMILLGDNLLKREFQAQSFLSFKHPISPHLYSSRKLKTITATVKSNTVAFH